MMKNSMLTSSSAATLFLAGLLLALTACAGSGREYPPDGREEAPEIRLATVEGGEVSSRDFLGQVVVLDFWATWCAPCHEQAEILADLHEEIEGEGVQILSIDVSEKEEKVRAFMEKNPAPYPVLLDVEGKVSDSFKVMALPTMVILDRRGRIAYSSTGVTSGNELLRVIEGELAGAEAG